MKLDHFHTGKVIQMLHAIQDIEWSRDICNDEKLPNDMAWEYFPTVSQTLGKFFLLWVELWCPSAKEKYITYLNGM